MGLRPATPGFIVTLIATILLAVVTFNVPFIKSVYFLQASLTVDNVNGTITLGTLGYCIDLSTNGTTCSKASVGYEFNPNALLGDDVSFAQIPTVVVKWITYALFLHAIALAVAAVSALFGLLAHVREMSMTCCSTFVSGFAAIITLVAFVFDIVLFFIVKERIKSIDGTATFGTAVWLTLASWILLFFSGCVYACGRCCISRRQRGGPADDGRLDQSWMGRFAGQNGQGAPGAGGYAEQMRLDAVKAEADRKARQKGEIGLPPFPGHDATQPLNSTKPQYLEDESDDEVGAGLPYRDQARGAAAMGPRMQGQQQQQQYRGGYAQAPPGTRAVDEYYSPTRTEANVGYPPSRQYTGSASASARSPPPSTYATSMYSSSAATTAGAAGVGAGAGASAAAGYFAGAQTGHSQYPSGREYGHTGGGTTYQSAVSSQHQQYPSAYSQYNDPYAQQANAGPIGVAVPMASPYTTATPSPVHSTSPPLRQASQHAQYYSQAQNTSPASAYSDAYGAQQQQHQPERSYTLGGGGYGANVVPDHSASAAGATAYGVGAIRGSPPPALMPGVGAAAAAGGSRDAYAEKSASQNQPQQSQSQQYDDSPPVYEPGPDGPSVHVAEWGSKGQGFHVDSR